MKPSLLIAPFKKDFVVKERSFLGFIAFGDSCCIPCNIGSAGTSTGGGPQVKHGILSGLLVPPEQISLLKPCQPLSL